MSTRTIDAHEDAKVNTEPLWIRMATISTLVVTRETANLLYDLLQRGAGSTP